MDIQLREVKQVRIPRYLIIDRSANQQPKQGKDEEESNIFREERLMAQANDRKKIAELEGIVEQLRESNETFDQRVQDLMQEQLKVRISCN